MSRGILLVAKSGPAIGLGHAMRTRAVAIACVRRGLRTRFVVEDEATERTLRDGGLDTEIELDHRGDRSWAEALVPGPEWEAAWLDGFIDWCGPIARLRSAGTRCFVVENRTASRVAADGIVYPALHWEPDDWDLAHPEKVRGGPAWIPLQPELLVEPEPARRDVDLLISFGGSDPHRSTERVLRLLPRGAGRIAVVTGPHMNERREAIARMAEIRGDAELVPKSDGLTPWIARSRTAVTALGTTLYELAFRGVRGLVLANYESDLAALDFYERAGPHVPVGTIELSDEDLAEALGRALARARRAGRPSVDGLGAGAERVASWLTGSDARAA